MKKRILALIAITVILLGMLVLPRVRGEDSVNVEASNPSVCPSSGSWTKIDVPGNNATPDAVSFSAPEGQVIEAICVKGGQEGVSPGGYLHTFTENGWFVKDGTNCILATGIGIDSATVSRNTDAPGNVCAEISHASFKTVDAEETPEPSPTPTEEETPPPTEEPTDEPVVVDAPTGAPRPVNRTAGIITMFIGALGMIGLSGFFLWKYLKA